MRFWSSFLALLLLCQTIAMPAVLAARPSVSDDDPVTARAKIHLEAGVAYFNEGQYPDAEREMTRAYDLRPVPELRYNLAQCQERLGALDRAVISYRAYLQGRPSASDAAAVNERIADLDKRIAERAKNNNTAPTVEPPPAQETPTKDPLRPPPPTAAVPPPEKVIFKEIIVYKEPPPKAGRGARFVGYGMLGLVAAGLATGIAFTVATEQINVSITEQSANYQELFGLKIESCPNMSLQEQAVLAKATSDAVAVAPGNPNLQQQIVNQISDSYRKASSNSCEFHRIASENGRLNTIGAVVGYSVAGLAVAATVGLFLYGRHLDKKQARQLESSQRRVPNLSFNLHPTIGPAGGGLVFSTRF